MSRRQHESNHAVPYHSPNLAFLEDGLESWGGRESAEKHGRTYSGEDPR